ncbi:MAG: hypothetical protein B0D91_00695 [Oceanospirillales bacterium LUC14_002_19_P2]|nr:MAG: hypothetical protein B0D91_00695 [Oceanospirillales bacterium LUC14_002_19_P2]
MRMNPEDFLCLTTTQEKLAAIMTEVVARPAHVYGQGNPQCLGIDIHTGKVLYHDGRHRAAQAKLEKQSFEVEIRLHDASHRLSDEEMCTRHQQGMDFHCAVWGDPLPGEVSGVECQRSKDRLPLTLRSNAA